MSARLVILLLAVTTSLGVMAAGQSAQVEISEYDCSTTGNYTDGSQYEKNLAVLLSTLSGAASASNGWFRNGSVGTAAPDQVSGLIMCYADCDPARCQDCLRRAATAPGAGGLTGLCPHSRNMSFLNSDGCVLRYEDAPFFGAAATDSSSLASAGPPIGDAADAAAMNATRWRLFSQLAERAGHGAPRRLANGSLEYAGSRGGGAQVVYGLAQCTGDLAPSECARCLMRHLAEVTEDKDIANATHASVHGFSCYLRYQVNEPIDLAGGGGGAAAPAPSPQPPAGPSGAAAPLPTGSTTTTLMAGLAAAASTAVILAAGV